jgi:molybdate transport system substrate-binding protein
MKVRSAGPCFALLLGAASLLLCLGCRSEQPGVRNQPILILAAASTRDALQEAARQFTRDTAVEVKISGDDSSKLAQQIVNGAPADLFLSANEKWADFVKDKGHAQASKKLLGNALVIVTPKGNPAGVTQPDDLRKPAVKKIAVAGPTVPAGLYARQALKHHRLWEALDSAGKIVSGENVRVTLSYVERGECEAGVVYSTDARITDQAASVHTFDPASHDPIVYPLLLLRTDNPAAGKLYDYLQSPPAQAVFRKHGFFLTAP